MWDLFLIYITEVSIKSYACTQIFRPSQKKFLEFLPTSGQLQIFLN